MSGDANRDILVNALIKAKDLNGRYINIKCVNWPPNPGEYKRGYFSLVFKAYDTRESKDVAIKFYDPGNAPNVYRLNCFKREPEILKQLLDKKRCLQLVEEMAVHTIKVVIPGGLEFDLHCGYFVTDWIDYDIDDYFY